MFSVTEQDEFLAKQGVFTYKIFKGHTMSSHQIWELICQLVHVDPAPPDVY